MAEWTKLDLGNGFTSAPQREQIQNSFMKAFMLAGGPSDVALFSRYDLEADNVTLYFSPAAKAYGAAFGATPCPKPSSDQIALLVGEAGALVRFFPDKTK